jgi:hypothetical protein
MKQYFLYLSIIATLSLLHLPLLTAESTIIIERTETVNFRWGAKTADQIEKESRKQKEEETKRLEQKYGTKVLFEEIITKNHNYSPPSTVVTQRFIVEDSRKIKIIELRKEYHAQGLLNMAIDGAKFSAPLLLIGAVLGVIIGFITDSRSSTGN